ncbi:MAG: hypothetical protein LC100_00170 [Chitinophagales bacterium]|nr:hypothetical protein [Chitinophagales bacterium]
MLKNRINEAEVMQIPQKIVKAGNSKVSEYVAVVNMPAGFTCPADAPCKAGCYALKGRYSFNNVTLPAWRNLYFFNSNPTGFFKAIENELQEADDLRPWRWFRWHESGDIVNYDYFCGMVTIAKKFKRINFMAYTKKYSIVNQYIEENGALPKNLTIIFGVWGVYGLGVNKYNLPYAYVKGVGADEYIPTSAAPCEGSCKECGFKCWKLKKRQSVVFDKH